MKKNKLSILRKEFRIYNIDGYIIPKNDEFFGEYVVPSSERLKYLTGFSGSAGQALTLKKKAFLFVDGRYILQAQKEIKKGFRVLEIHKIKPLEILKKNKKKLISNYTVSIYINLIYLLLIIPAIIFMDNGLFCRYYFFSLLIIYIYFYKMLYKKVK